MRFLRLLSLLTTFVVSSLIVPSGALADGEAQCEASHPFLFSKIPFTGTDIVPPLEPTAMDVIIVTTVDPTEPVELDSAAVWHRIDTETETSALMPSVVSTSIFYRTGLDDGSAQPHRVTLTGLAEDSRVIFWKFECVDTTAIADVGPVWTARSAPAPGLLQTETTTAAPGLFITFFAAATNGQGINDVYGFASRACTRGPNRFGQHQTGRLKTLFHVCGVDMAGPRGPQSTVIVGGHPVGHTGGLGLALVLPDARS